MPDAQLPGSRPLGTRLSAHELWSTRLPELLMFLIHTLDGLCTALDQRARDQLGYEGVASDGADRGRQPGDEGSTWLSLDRRCLFFVAR